MNNVCTKNWKEFRIGGKNGLFEVTRPNARSAQTYSDGDMPYIASGCFNNGVCGYFEQKDKNDFDKGNCITVSPVDGYAFYQKDDFLGRGGAGSSIIILRRDNLNEYVGKFICTIIRKTCKDWTYSNMGNKDKLKDTIIKLPVKKNNEPDWEYMESYMKNIMQETEKQLSCLNNIDNNKHRINSKEWKEFIIGDLFKDIIKPPVLHTKDVTEDINGIPYVVRTKFDNGIKYNVEKTKIMQPSPAGTISFGAENATFFYQEKEYVSGRDIYYIDTHNIKKYACLFLVTCLQTISEKYSYNYGMFPELVKKEIIKLPVNKKNEPDWEYMGQYMKNIMEDTQSKLNKLVCC